VREVEPALPQLLIEHEDIPSVIPANEHELRYGRP
jgi:hypothetical protein